ncbi:MAG: ATP-binding protein [Bifidobacteriaceae bacterium]|jgi:type II secretory pathway predicted ATPase ExeA|nr:ATP-binding protein [Bifidobacteriaceae bacterium]
MAVDFGPNPFTPTFGVDPPLLAGRDYEIGLVRRALGAAPGHPGRTVFITGPRGTGKTVLLNALEAVARQTGWQVISETVQPNLAEILTTASLPLALAAADPDGADSRVTGVSASVLGIGGSVTRQVSERYPVQPGLRQQLELLAHLLKNRHSGVFVALDEVHRSEITELTPLFHAIQHCLRQGLPVAFAAAGLPSAIADLLNADVLTYLRRAERFTLGALPAPVIGPAILEPFARAGRSIEEPALDLAVGAVQGYPFLIQVVGFELWEAAAGSQSVGVEVAQTAVGRAQRTAGRLVHEPALRDLSAADRAFLSAVARLSGETVRVSEVAAALGATRDHASKYRARLIAAQVIEAAGRGQIRFAIPFLREYLLREDP